MYWCHYSIKITYYNPKPSAPPTELLSDWWLVSLHLYITKSKIVCNKVAKKNRLIIQAKFLKNAGLRPTIFKIFFLKKFLFHEIFRQTAPFGYCGTWSKGEVFIFMSPCIFSRWCQYFFHFLQKLLQNGAILNFLLLQKRES